MLEEEQSKQEVWRRHYSLKALLMKSYEENAATITDLEPGYVTPNEIYEFNVLFVLAFSEVFD